MIKRRANWPELPPAILKKNNPSLEPVNKPVEAERPAKKADRKTKAPTFTGVGKPSVKRIIKPTEEIIGLKKLEADKLQREIAAREAVLALHDEKADAAQQEVTEPAVINRPSKIATNNTKGKQRPKQIVATPKPSVQNQHSAGIKHPAKAKIDTDSKVIKPEPENIMTIDTNHYKPAESTVVLDEISGDEETVSIASEALEVPVEDKPLALYEQIWAEEAPPQLIVLPENGERIIDIDVINAYQQLARFDEQPQAVPEITIAASYENFAEDQEVALKPEAVAISEVNPFEEFVIARPAPEQPVALETIQAAASKEQSLEETLTQLAFYLAGERKPIEALENSGTSEASEVAEQSSLEEISEQLLMIADDLDKLEHGQLPPELNQKLLVLLNTVGYRDPQAALSQFVEKRGFEYLIQAVNYLHRLSNEDRQHELISHALKASAPLAYEPFTVSIGRFVFKLLKTKLEIPKLASA